MNEESWCDFAKAIFACMDRTGCGADSITLRVYVRPFGMVLAFPNDACFLLLKDTPWPVNKSPMDRVARIIHDSSTGETARLAISIQRYSRLLMGENAPDFVSYDALNEEKNYEIINVRRAQASGVLNHFALFEALDPFQSWYGMEI